MDTPQSSGVGDAVQRILRWVGTLGGAVVAVGAFAFATGFLAERAQYEYAQIPFVFVDYWAYAESGFTLLLDSGYLLAPWWGLLAIVPVGAIAIVLLMEVESFRAFLSRPHWLFVGYLVWLALIGLTIRQELIVRASAYSLADSSARQQLPDVEQAAGVAQQPVPMVLTPERVIDARWPFSWFVPDAASLPTVDSRWRTGHDSFSAWRQIADELELSSSQDRMYFELRRAPEWTSVSSGSHPIGSFLGVQSSGQSLESNRAQVLYSSLVLVITLLGCLLGGLVLWDSKVLSELQQGASSALKEAKPHVLFPLREELWFASHWILRPIAIIALLSGLVLLAESYGILAMPRLGHELVEIVVASSEQARSSSENQPDVADRLSGLNDDASGDEIVRRLYSAAEDLALKYPLTDPEDREKLRSKWQDVIINIEKMGRPSSVESLRRLSDLSAVLSPPLMPEAADAMIRATVQLGLPRSGYIVAYPRSQTEYLRLLVNRTTADGGKWAIYPVRMAAIAEIRVRQDGRTPKLVDMLRRLDTLDPEDRVSAIVEIRRLGHPRTLEIMMAALLDPSPMVRGYAITDVARAASMLPRTAAGQFRRARAEEMLLSVLLNDDERPDHRAAAATSLRFVSQERDPRVCQGVSLVLQSQCEPGRSWELCGPLLTSIGRMQCAGISALLEKVVRDPNAPIEIRATVPTALHAGRDARSVNLLRALVRDDDTPEYVRDTSITAVGLLAKGSEDVVADLVVAGRRARVNDRMEQRWAVITALQYLGHRSAVPFLSESALRATEPEEMVRRAAIFALADLNAPESESVLMSIAEDSDELTEIRVFAVKLLPQFTLATSTARLERLACGSTAPLELVEASGAALIEIANNGAGRASKSAERAEECRAMQAAAGEAWDSTSDVDDLPS